MRRDGQRVADIHAAMAGIAKYVARGREAFLADELIQTFIVHHLQVIGEAANRLSPAFQTAHPQLPWSSMAGMRHVLVHDYFKVDLDLVWDTASRDLPALEVKLRGLLTRLETEERADE